MRSESCTFIWQPYVSMKYFILLLVCRGAPPPRPTTSNSSASHSFPARSWVRFRSFAFAFCIFFATGQQLARGGASRICRRGTTNHTRDLFDARSALEPRDVGLRATLPDRFRNLEM